MARIAYFLTHPIQYQSPLIRRLVAEEGVHLHVYYSTDNTSRSYFDPGYDRKVEWDLPLLEGYPHTILNHEQVNGSRVHQVAFYRKQIEEAVPEGSADVFWLHGWSAPFVVAAWKVARARGLPIWLRGETSVESLRGGRFGHLLHRAFYQRAFREVSLFLAMGTLNRRLYERYGVPAARLQVMPHAVDNAFFQRRVTEAEASREKLRATLGLPADAVVLLYCGRLAKEKDVITLIRAAAMLHHDGATKLAVLIVGDGPMREELQIEAERTAPGLAYFTGFRNQTELPAIYQLADLFVLPSLFETWGLVVNEAMNAARPVILSDRVGCRLDLVREGENGSVFQAGNAEHLAATLRPWIQDPEKREKGGRASLEIINHWGLDEDAAGFVSAVRSLDSAIASLPKKKPRVAFIFTHEIQYFTNVLEELHRRGRVEVFGIYARHTKTMLDTGFNRVIEWDNRASTNFPSMVLSPPVETGRQPSAGTWCWNVFRELSRFAPDVVHLNGYSAAVQWLAWFWALLNHKPFLVRGDGDTFGGPSRSGGTRAGLLLSRLFTRRAAHVFYQGAENRAFWQQRGAKPEAMSWIPCVPDNEIYRKPEFSTHEERAAFRSQAGAGPADTVFIVSGKLDPRKRPQDAVDVLEKLRASPCKVWFLGSGVLEDTLKQRAREMGVDDRIYWWGFRNQSELPRILQAADVLLHPSQQDPWPYSVLEGAMCGLALLLSDQTGSHPDLIGEAGAGRIFRCGDLDDMARVMREAAESPDQVSIWRAAARRVSLEHSEARFCEIFEKALQLAPAD